MLIVLAKIQFFFANSWLDSPKATCLSLTGTLGGESEPAKSVLLHLCPAAGYLARTLKKYHDLQIFTWPTYCGILGDVTHKKIFSNRKYFFIEFSNFKIHPLHPVLAWHNRMRPIYVTWCVSPMKCSFSRKNPVLQMSRLTCCAKFRLWRYDYVADLNRTRASACFYCFATWWKAPTRKPWLELFSVVCKRGRVFQWHSRTA